MVSQDLDLAHSLSILEDLGTLSSDPLAFVYYAFPWGEPGTELESRQGPEQWQIDVLTDIRDGLLDNRRAILQAIASGHGIGKSALVSWLILWAISTFEDTKGVVTASTETQLRTKTWPELSKWHRLFIGKEFFDLTATSICSRDKNHAKEWRIDAIPWSISNPTGFQGLHNQGKRILIIFDEASEIADIIWEAAEGALSDAGTQIVWFAAGNPTSNKYRFRQLAPDGTFTSMWRFRAIDSRTVSFTNHALIQQQIAIYGEDSDWTRVRVKGEFPYTDFTQFIPQGDYDNACKALWVEPAKFDPLIMGVDVARFGDDESVIFFRKGRDARSIAPERRRGLDTVALAALIVELANLHRPDAIFIDEGGVGGGVVDACRYFRLDVYGIQFGSKPDYAFGTGERYYNKRAEMYGNARQWIKHGGLLDQDLVDLRKQLMAINYKIHTKSDSILLEEKAEMKSREGFSPDIADAFALTFAFPVSPNPQAGFQNRGLAQPNFAPHEYNPYEKV